jgi:hypothetical protein
LLYFPFICYVVFFISYISFSIISLLSFWSLLKSLSLSVVSVSSWVFNPCSFDIHWVVFLYSL